MDVRLSATKAIWVGYTLAMLAIFAGTAVMGQSIGAGHVVMAIVISITAFLSTGTVWNWGNLPLESDTSEYSKQKNQARIERLLDQLSDAELLHLKQRLSGDNMEDDHERYALSDDGELVMFDR